MAEPENTAGKEEDPESIMVETTADPTMAEPKTTARKEPEPETMEEDPEPTMVHYCPDGSVWDPDKALAGMLAEIDHRTPEAKERFIADFHHWIIDGGPKEDGPPEKKKGGT